MNYVKIVNNQADKYPYSIENLKDDHPNISFPDEITTDILIEYGLKEVILSDPPNFDPTIQKITRGPMPVLDGDSWVLNWNILDLTVEELSLKLEAASLAVRMERDKLLTESDWTQVADAPVDQSAWALYRQYLRDIPSQSGFPYTIDWPIKPV